MNQPLRTRRLVFLLLILLTGSGLAAPHSSAQRPFRILVTNDDGVRAAGLLAVAQALQAVGEVTIVAPAENQSGKSQSITITDPVYVDQVTLSGGLQALGATATPASCVKIALFALMKERPDLVVSGINRGYNLGMNAYISGTVGAAREAALHGVAAIASSMDVAGGWNDYSAAAALTADVARLVKAHGLPAGAFLNVNVPAGQPKGLRLATQSRLMGTETWVEHTNPRGRRYFWNSFEDSPTDAEGTDVWVVSQGHAAVVPLRASEFDAGETQRLQQWIGR